MRKWLRGQQIFWEGRWDKMIRCHNFGDQLINYSSWREYVVMRNPGGDRWTGKMRISFSEKDGCQIW